MSLIEKRTETSKSKSRLFIVGEDHCNESDQRFKDRLVGFASQGRIALGVEGLVRNRKAEQAYVRAAYGIENGLVFGIEDDLVNLYTGTILHFNYLAHAAIQRSIGFVPQEMREAVLMAKVQLVYDATESETMKTCWARIKARDLPEKVKRLYGSIDAFIIQNNGSKLEDRVRNFTSAQNKFGFLDDWAELFKLLTSEIGTAVSDLPEDQRPDLEPIKRYLDDPRDNDAWDYIQNELNAGWRDRFLLKNIVEISEIASAKHVDSYVIVGEGHVRILSDMLARTNPGLHTISYDSSGSIPNEEIPGF